jgi:hypothetical protein
VETPGTLAAADAKLDFPKMQSPMPKKPANWLRPMAKLKLQTKTGS